MSVYYSQSAAMSTLVFQYSKALNYEYNLIVFNSKLFSNIADFNSHHIIKKFISI